MNASFTEPSGLRRPPDAAIVAVRTQRRPNRFGRRWVVMLGISDLFMFAIAALTAVEIVTGGRFRPSPESSVLFSTLAFATLWFVIFERLGLYQRSFALSVKDELYYTTAALALGALPQFVLFMLFPAVSSSRLVLILSLVFSVLTVGGSRAMLHFVRERSARLHPRRVAVIGTPNRIAAALESLDFSDDVRVLQLLEMNLEESLCDVSETAQADLGRIAWLRQARAWGCDLMLFTEVVPPAILPSLLEMTAREGITLAFAPPRLCTHAYDYTLRTDGHQALIFPSRLGACRPGASFLKRTLDITVSCAALVVFAPVMLAAALTIAIESGRPVFFSQERVGRNGRIFRVLKFRTMKVDAENETGPVWARRGDPRTTRCGAFLRRTSIDELPQLFNVVRGEMSLVGPRPERPVFAETFRRQLPRYHERHLVRPGITGWSQVHMKRVLNLSDVSEKLSHDLFYVENWSIFMDVSVIVKTGFEFLFHRAA